jgi:transposase
MSRKSDKSKLSSVRLVKDIRRRARQCPAEDKIRIVLGGLRGQHSVAKPSRRSFWKAAKRRLAGDGHR